MLTIRVPTACWSCPTVPDGLVGPTHSATALAPLASVRLPVPSPSTPEQTGAAPRPGVSLSLKPFLHPVRAELCPLPDHELRPAAPGALFAASPCAGLFRARGRPSSGPALPVRASPDTPSSTGAEPLSPETDPRRLRPGSPAGQPLSARESLTGNPSATPGTARRWPRSCDRFLHLLGCLHRPSAPALRAALRHGYPLHLDATCDPGRDGLLLSLDGWHGWVLHAARIRTENVAALQSVLQATLDDFGPPLAFVRDLGSAVAKAVANCRTPPSLDLVCHFHFLAAVGGRLLDADHATLRRGLPRWKVRSGLRALLRSAGGPGFPASGCQRGTDLRALLYWAVEGQRRAAAPPTLRAAPPCFLPALPAVQPAGRRAPAATALPPRAPHPAACLRGARSRPGERLRPDGRRAALGAQSGGLRNPARPTTAAA